MRYLPLSEADRAQMLAAIGVQTIDGLFRDVPPHLLNPPLNLPPPMSEIQVERALAACAAKNRAAEGGPSFLGAGAYRHHIPASVDHLIQRSEFMTAYTPYQPEIAQGTLQMLFEFQTQTALLTGMDVANASMYDGSNACAEAVLMAHRITKRPKAVLSPALHPHYRACVETLSGFAGKEVVEATPAGGLQAMTSAIDADTACLVVQNPDAFGAIADLAPLAEAAHARGALLIAVFTEALALAAIKPPGEMGADIAVGEGQSFGNPTNFGGPYLGLFAAREKFLRQMPGRLCGEARDAQGRRGYVLTLAAREQHIRRERATSNICTNAGLCCLAFTCHLALLGGEGLARLAAVNHAAAVQLAEALEAIPGVRQRTPDFFNEFTFETPIPGAELTAELARQNILAGVPASRLWPERENLKNCVITAATELNTAEDVNAYASALRKLLA